MGQSKAIRVGNAGGYWGDDLDALVLQLARGDLDYVTLDFLAEITMSILQKQRQRNPQLGYATDFVEQMGQCMPWLKQKRVKVISSAGGIQPRACAEKLAELGHRENHRFRIAVVEGDDLLQRLDDLVSAGHRLQNMETGESVDSILGRVESANAYLGAAPVIRALEEEADLIVTGRVTDTGIVSAIPASEFGWSLDDWDRMASGVVAGHILECGAQASGGNLTDWREVPSFLDMGYPIAEFSPDGSFHVTKADGTGGLVNRKTVTSQLIYEMGDPTSYVTPDVIADFTTLTLREAGDDRVEISGVRGRPGPNTLKVSITYRSGYKAHGTMIVSQPEAVDKARLLAEILWKRLDLQFEECHTELVGYDACHRQLAPAAQPSEILLRLGVRDPERDKVEAFAKKFTSLILNTVGGVAIVGARPRVQEVVAYWPCLVPAELVTPQVFVLDSGRVFQIPHPSGPATPPPVRHSRQTAMKTELPGGRGAKDKVLLKELCYARSGDKGDTCNIGVVARSEKIYPRLCEFLTAERVKDYFGDLCRGSVERYRVDNLRALNFLLHQSLGGGGTLSLRIDPQGKTLADALLLMPVEVSSELLD